ncbi:MAG: hypothetical protein HUJ98_13575, partial [Bacteroidaceae bacterium]|nr:hypothetical protein [Bacteroidaceae bacterium]
KDNVTYLEAKLKLQREGTAEWYKTAAALNDARTALLNANNALSDYIAETDAAIESNDILAEQQQKNASIEQRRHLDNMEMLGMEIERSQKLETGWKSLFASGIPTIEQKLALIKEEYEMKKASLALDEQQINNDEESLMKQKSLLSEEEFTSQYQAILERRNSMSEQYRQIELDMINASNEAKLDSYRAYAEGMMAITNALGSIIGSFGENAVQGTKQWKNVKIAEATISTLTGALQAFMQAQATYAPPLGMAIGAANAASVMATGIASINKIKNTKVSSTSSNTTGFNVKPGAVATASTNYDQIQNVNNYNAITGLGDQRVYVTVGDIERGMNRKKAVVSGREI